MLTWDEHEQRAPSPTIPDSRIPRDYMDSYRASMPHTTLSDETRTAPDSRPQGADPPVTCGLKYTVWMPSMVSVFATALRFWWARHSLS